MAWRREYSPDGTPVLFQGISSNLFTAILLQYVCERESYTANPKLKDQTCCNSPLCTSSTKSFHHRGATGRIIDVYLYPSCAVQRGLWCIYLQSGWMGPFFGLILKPMKDLQQCSSVIELTVQTSGSKFGCHSGKDLQLMHDSSLFRDGGIGNNR